MLSDVREFLTTAATISRQTAGTGWDSTPTWATNGTTTCYIGRPSGGQATDYGQTGTRSTHRMYCDSDTVIADGDRVTADGNVYAVRFVAPRTALGDAWLEIDLEYLEAEQ
jgi:hypothetical protein